MKKKLCLFVTTVVLSGGLISTQVFAKENNNNKKSTPVPVIVYTPATGNIINGVEQSTSNIKPNILLNSTMIDYQPSTAYIVPFWQEIASSYIDNRGNSTPYSNTLTITYSESKGSEFSGSFEVNAESKNMLLGKIGAKIGFGVKVTRTTNEAVGASGTITIPAGRQGYNKAYYEGVSSSGTATIRQYETSSAQGYYDYTTPVGAIVHPNALRVNFRPVII